MASVKRFTLTTPAWVIEKTTTYSVATPADSPSAFAVTAAAFDAEGLSSPTINSTALGVLFTFDATARPTSFVGIRAKITPTYTGTGRALALWTYNGSAWTEQLFTFIDHDENNGVASGSEKLMELWLDTPVTGVQKVWVSYTSAAGVTNGGFTTVHLYESAAETTTNPFDAETGDPYHTGYDLRPRAATVAGVKGNRFCLAYQLDRTPDPGDDPVDSDGAWSVLDLNATACCQTTDEQGNDVIVYAVPHLDGDFHAVVTLDWDRFQDEFYWDADPTPIYRRWAFGPVPFLPDNDNTETTARYELDLLKRFRALMVQHRFPPTDATTQLRISVEEFGVSGTTRTQTYVTAQRTQVQIAVRGMQFRVLVEHAANEDWQPFLWKALWDVLGPRILQNAVA